MIVSHRHEFIFVRTRKTASTSVELYLRQFCGPEDIITVDTRTDELLARSLGLPGPQHWGGPLVLPWRLTGAEVRWARNHRIWPRRPRIDEHSTASTIRALVGSEVWSRYRKIVTVRDPWESVVSFHFWRVRNLSEAERRDPSRGFTLDDSVERAGWNWSTYTIDGVPDVDHIIRFENLTEDLADVTSELGLEPRLDLVRAKTQFRPPGTSAPEVLTFAQVRRVAELAKDEIAWLGYSWSGADPS